MSHPTNTLPVPAIDRAPAGRLPYAVGRHDRAVDPVQAARIEGHVDRILEVLRAAVPVALSRAALDIGSETAESIADDIAGRIRAAQA